MDTRPINGDLTSELRARVVAEALTWQGTRYHHQASVKGVGVDCLMIIVRVGQAVGLIDPGLKIPPYSTQFNLHRSSESYLEGLLGHMREVEIPRPGDVAIWKFGRCFSHAGIIKEWPTVIHASNAAGCVVVEDIETIPWLKNTKHKGAAEPRPVKFLSIW